MYMILIWNNIQKQYFGNIIFRLETELARMPKRQKLPKLSKINLVSSFFYIENELESHINKCVHNANETNPWQIWAAFMLYTVNLLISPGAYLISGKIARPWTILLLFVFLIQSHQTKPTTVIHNKPAVGG